MIYASQNNNIPLSGRLGNQIFRLMSLIGMAKTYNTIYAIPTWKYAKYFNGVINQQDNVLINRKLTEPAFNYIPEFWDRYAGAFKNSTIDIFGFLQSPKYWEDAKQEVFETLAWDKTFIALIKAKYKDWLNSSTTVAVSVRRGDFIGNPNYYQLTLDYYKSALLKFGNMNVIFFSDDISWCRDNFFSDRYHYCDAEDIEQLALMSLCSNFIISNSTFSYVGAYLANRGKVIRPKQNFAGKFALTKSEKDYWVKEWIIFDEKVKQVV